MTIEYIREANDQAIRNLNLSDLLNHTEEEENNDDETE